jgi:hypothetical protein
MAYRVEAVPQALAHPNRKMTPHWIRNIRADYRARRKAERQIAEARAILMVIPTCNDYARELGVNQNVVLSAAMGLTYREVQD